jgi:[ribosomal protein S5]-alanine N-acetyltransferase
MEKMPYQVSLDVQTVTRSVEESRHRAPADWRSGLPVLSDGRVTLRELRPSDATSLFSMLSSEEVLRFVSPPPPDVKGFERFIEWAHAERAAGRYACFAVVPAGYDVAVGIVQVKQLDPAFSSAEWGACLGSQFWGTGTFTAAARLLLNFTFDVIGSHRLEARAAVQNGRGNGGMRKLGAVQEGVLRRSLWCRGQYHDQILWSILAEDWRQSRIELRPRIH